MAEPTVIGRSAFIRGRIHGSGDIEIAGRVEGDIAASGGEVLVDSSGLVAADISARRIVVRGAVRGNLTADEAVVLESGARVVGDLRAPRIAIAPGGLVRGHVQTASGGGGTRPVASRAAATVPSRTSAAPARSTAAATTRAPSGLAASAASALTNVRDNVREAREREERARAAAAPTTPTKPVPAAPPPASIAPSTSKASNGSASKSTPAPSAQRSLPLGAARPGPPPPVVPVLKKGTKAVQKKR